MHTPFGRPPLHKFTNVYWKDTTYTESLAMFRDNGGAPLHENQFDVNILRPGNPAESPHFVSPRTGNAYCLAWQVQFHPRCLGNILPHKRIYLNAITADNEMFVQPTGQPVKAVGFESGVVIYDDVGMTHRIGVGWVEQIGMN